MEYKKAVKRRKANVIPIQHPDNNNLIIVHNYIIMVNKSMVILLLPQ